MRRRSSLQVLKGKQNMLDDFMQPILKLKWINYLEDAHY
jgi:hypothetical protein